MLDIERTRAEGEKLTQAIGDLLGVQLTPELATKLFEIAMGETCMGLYRVSLLYAQEADKCRGADAYFPASLMIASAIETLLALICLMAEEEVKRSSKYKSWKTRKNTSFQDKVLGAFFQDYIDVATDLDWVPSSAVDAELLKAALQDFPLICSNLYPNDSSVQRIERLEKFQTRPGVEMLCILQGMRNLIHGPRWPRLGVKVTADFDADCKFVFVVSFQVMACLFETIIRKAKGRMADVDELRQRLSPKQISAIRDTILEMIGSSGRG
jgi:hypothetical protein